jgi:hypothetical protein
LPLDLARDNHGLLDAFQGGDRSKRPGDESFVQQVLRLLGGDLFPGRPGRPRKNGNQAAVPR